MILASYISLVWRMINGTNVIIKELFPITKHSSPQSWEAHVVLIDTRHVYSHTALWLKRMKNVLLHWSTFVIKPVKCELIAKKAPDGLSYESYEITFQKLSWMFSFFRDSKSLLTVIPLCIVIINTMFDLCITKVIIMMFRLGGSRNKKL
jgi:hypothetical protein